MISVFSIKNVRVCHLVKHGEHGHFHSFGNRNLITFRFSFLKNVVIAVYRGIRFFRESDTHARWNQFRREPIRATLLTLQYKNARAHFVNLGARGRFCAFSFKIGYCSLQVSFLEL
jgi:hypothetical protein